MSEKDFESLKIGDVIVGKNLGTRYRITKIEGEDVWMDFPDYPNASKHTIKRKVLADYLIIASPNRFNSDPRSP